MLALHTSYITCAHMVKRNFATFILPSPPLPYYNSNLHINTYLPHHPTQYRMLQWGQSTQTHYSCRHHSTRAHLHKLAVQIITCYKPQVNSYANRGLTWQDGSCSVTLDTCHTDVSTVGHTLVWTFGNLPSCGSSSLCHSSSFSILWAPNLVMTSHTETPTCQAHTVEWCGNRHF